MKKNRTMRIATLMLALTLITCCFVGSTFAKYTSSADMSTSVTVANWAFEFNDQNIVNTGDKPTVPFGLFDTILNTDGNAEDAVLAGKVAPGTKGSFTLNVENTSDVAAQYKIDFETTNVPTNFLFKVTVAGEVIKDGETEWFNDIKDVPFTYIDFEDANDDQAVVVDWMWAFETTGGDAADTANGIDPKTVGVTATITVEQVDKDPA